MKSIVKLSAVILALAVTFPSTACDPSETSGDSYSTTDSLSTQMMQKIKETYREASF